MARKISAHRWRVIVLDEDRRPVGTTIYCDDIAELSGCRPRFKLDSSTLVHVAPNPDFVPGSIQAHDKWKQ